MAGVTIEYKGAKIAELSDKEKKTLKTGGTYCEDDITVDYTGGVELPALTNEGAAADLMEGKQLISGAGEVVSGSFTLRGEMTEQSALLARIKSALAGKAAGGGGGDVQIEGLPKGYVRAGYIQFNADQAVDTGIIGNQNTKIKCLYTRETSSSAYLYGCASSDNTAAITAYFGGNWRFGSKATTVTPTTSEDLINTSIQDKTGVDRITANGGYSGVTAFETIGTLLLGACRNANGSVGTSVYRGKVFLFEIWQSSELVCKLVPVVSMDGEYALWDTVSQKFAESLKGNPFNGGYL